MKNTKGLTRRILKIVWVGVLFALTICLFSMYVAHGPMGILVGFLLFLSFGGDILLMVLYPGKSKHNDQ